MILANGYFLYDDSLAGVYEDVVAAIEDKEPGDVIVPGLILLDVDGNWIALQDQAEIELN